MSQFTFRLFCALFATLILTACGGGGSGGSSSDSRETNLEPSLQLSDGEVLGAGSAVIRIPASDDTGIVSVSSQIIRQ